MVHVEMMNNKHMNVIYNLMAFVETGIFAFWFDFPTQISGLLANLTYTDANTPICFRKRAYALF